MTVDDLPTYRTRFGGLDIAYDATVLEPRGWTLAQSVVALDLEPALPPGAVLELCSGAGHIGLVVAAGCMRSLVQVDASPTACDWARHNAARAGLADRVAVRCADVASLSAEPARFALAIADPPYVRSEETRWHPHDPVEAIDGGDDGLDVAKACLEALASALVPGGAAVVQARDHTQAVAYARWLPPGLAAKEVHTVEGGGALLIATRCGPGAELR
ncbi:MAG: methyltransferase domain-containing protein [Acidimicrobiales bacterium]